MPLESAQYISGLNASNPVANDQESQGDDHLRLIKSALQSTFPNASKPFYFPIAEAASADDTILASEDKTLFTVSAAAGAKTFTLPSGLGSGDAGWSVEFLKSDTSANAVIVTPASGTINGLVSLSIKSIHQSIRAFWNGSAWFGVISGRSIGELVGFCGTTAPPLFLFPFGQAVSRTTYAAAFAHLGTTFGSGDGATTFNLPDLRGRVEAGFDAMGGSDAGRLQASWTLGAVGGTETHTLTAAQIPSHLHTISITSGGQSVSHTHSYLDTHTILGGAQDLESGSGSSARGDTTQSLSTGFASTDHTHSVVGNTGLTGSGSSHNIMQPTIVLNKILYVGA